MFVQKLVLVAATLAVGSVGAMQQSSVHVRVHSNVKDACSNGQSPMSVEGVEGVFCVSGQSCVANIKGACPGPQAGLPYGAYCDTVKTGVLGCKPSPPPSTCTGANTSPMSVEGVEGIFCVTGQACVANIANGACPGPQAGLPNGAECGIVKTGVYGCKPKSAHKKHHKKHHGKTVCSGPGQSPMSVEGVEGVFCVSGQACVADIANGACPGPQEGLPNGSSCGKVITGVYGCKPNSAAPATPAPVVTPAPSTEAPATYAPATEAPATQAPVYQTPTTQAPVVIDVYISDDSDSSDSSDSIDICTGEGESPMSVEGVEGIFCVKGQACVADIKDGACPGPQKGLPYGASCGIVKTGVYGCQPNDESDDDSSNYSDDDDSTVYSDDDDSTVYSDDDSSDECGEGETPMSVEGVEGIFCVKGQACVADIKDGACPDPQDGLPYGASCGIVKTGVYGCKPNAVGKKHHVRKH